MAIEMGQFKAGFLARTSHELRSPLNSIMSLQQLILTDLCDDPAEERSFVAQSYEASQKLLALLNETTNISKLEEGTTDLTLDDLSLSAILSDVENITHLQARNRNLKLRVEIPDQEVKVVGDYRWLRQVLVNLVTTAIYQLSSGSIEVTSEVDLDHSQVHILIRDDRPPSAWSEPTDLLATLDNKQKPTTDDEFTSDPQTSRGLTLSLTQIMMEKMNGALVLLPAAEKAPAPAGQANISADSVTQSIAKQHGTRIQCSLPLAKA
jgi:K+-sensing histidine kinase KdpD